MDQHRPGSLQDASKHSESGEGGYAGAVGQTHYESVHLVEPDGSLRALAVCRAVNAKTHPELKQRALAGALHKLPDGRALALPYVYHDPDARKFALVLPTTLAHLELKEWSRLMAQVAEDTRHAVPPYVRECTTVLGIAALERFLESEHGLGRETSAALRVAPALAALGERGELMHERERELLEQERSLIRMAEGLTAREGELNRQREQLDTARVDLEIREAELASERLRLPPPRDGAALSGWKEQRAHLGTSEATVVANFSRELANAGNFALDADDGVHRSQPPPLRARSRTGPPPLPHNKPRVTPPPLTGRRDHEERTVVASSVPRATQPPPLPGTTLVTDETASFDDLAPELAPPAYFSTLHAGQMALKLEADELWLFVHVDEERAQSFRRGAELMLQYVELEAHPVIVLSVVDESGDEPYAIRLALDGNAEDDLRVLEHLARSFRARLALYVDGSYVETATVSTLRESVAQAIADKVSALPSERSLVGSADALLRVLQAPPPLRNDDLPFGPARRETPTTLTVLAAVEQLTSWMRPAKLAEAALTYSVPSHVIDATARRVLRAAVVFGIALPEEFISLAVTHGIAGDERALIRDELSAFRQRVVQNENDLGEHATRKNWDRLFAQAEARGVEVDDATRMLADSGSEAPVATLPSSRPLEGLSPGELRMRLDDGSDPEQRLEAIRELCTRGHVSAIDPVAAVLPDLSPHALCIAVAQLLGFGEASGDALLHGLSSPHQDVRHVCALGVGRLKLRRALVPLLKQVELEETPAWQELARAVGDFGAGALRTVVRSIPGASRPERIASVLAHLANHGCAKDVEKLENDLEPEVASAARKAMARRSRMEWEDLAVREQRTLTDGNPTARLSQAFYAEASKVAI